MRFIDLPVELKSEVFDGLVSLLGFEHETLVVEGRDDVGDVDGAVGSRTPHQTGQEEKKCLHWKQKTNLGKLVAGLSC